MSQKHCKPRELRLNASVQGGKGQRALRLAMNTGTFNFQKIDLLSAVNALSKSEFQGINLRDNHIQDYIRSGHSIREIKDLLEKHGLHPVAVDALREWQNWAKWDRKKQAAYVSYVEQFFYECKQLGCRCIAAPAFAEESDVRMDVRAFKKMCDNAKGHDISVALEFLPWAEVRDIQRAWEVVEQADCLNGGLLIDTFHFFKGGSQIEHFRQVPVEKIFLIHLNDAPDLPLDSKEMCFNHRVFPGEGIFPLNEFLSVLLLEKGYEGWISLEVLNKGNENRDYSDIVDRGEKSIERVLRPLIG